MPNVWHCTMSNMQINLICQISDKIVMANIWHCTMPNMPAHARYLTRLLCQISGIVLCLDMPFDAENPTRSSWQIFGIVLCKICPYMPNTWQARHAKYLATTCPRPRFASLRAYGLAWPRRRHLTLPRLEHANWMVNCGETQDINKRAGKGEPSKKINTRERKIAEKRKDVENCGNARVLYCESRERERVE